MSQQTPPRLNTDAGTQLGGYAPISWTAVGALTVSVVFLVVLAAMGIIAFRNGKPLIEPPLLFFPALAVVLAFVARRQIKASEGTRTGDSYANAAWWIAVVCGLGYVSYLFAIDYLIRNQANTAFDNWVGFVKEADPNNPKDPNIYEACYLTLPPGERAAVNPRDPQSFEHARQAELVAFRQIDAVRICGRNRGATEFRVHGIKDWQQKPTEISCILAATLATPEGEYELIVPLRATMDDKKGYRWQIVPQADGYVKQKTLTRYGWMIEYLEGTGRQTAREFMSRVGQPDPVQATLAYLAYVKPDADPRRSTESLSEIAKTTEPRAAAVGGTAGVVFPQPPELRSYLIENVFAKPGGAKPGANDVDTFLRCWTRPNRIVPSGSVVRSNPDLNPVLIVNGKDVELRVPCELVTSSDNAVPAAARGRLVLRPTELGGAFTTDFLAAREAGAAAPKSDKPPLELAQYVIPWKIVKIESDLATVENKAPPGGPPGGGGGGPPPGMMGGG